MKRLCVENPSDTSFQWLCQEFNLYLLRLRSEEWYARDLNERFAKVVDAGLTIQYKDGRTEFCVISTLESAFETITDCHMGEVAWFQWNSRRFAPI